MAKKTTPSGWKPGRWIEHVVERIESQLLTSSDSKATIESPKELPDRDTGRPRQHDVVITHRVSHHDPFLIAIECKDRSRAVDVEKVEAFQKKCERTGIHLGVMVSALGFTAGAKEKATAFGIRCLDIKDVEKLDWISNTEFLSVGREIRDTNLVCNIESDSLQEIAQPCTIVYADGRPMTGDDVSNMAQSMFEPIQVDEDLTHPAGTLLQRSFHVPFPDAVYVVDSNGSEFVSHDAVMTSKYMPFRDVVPLFLYKYVNSLDQSGVSTAAVAEITVGNMNLVLTMAGPDDGEKHVSLKFLKMVESKKNRS